jgi:hypothetical protein
MGATKIAFYERRARLGSVPSKLGGPKIFDLLPTRRRNTGPRANADAWSTDR